MPELVPVWQRQVELAGGDELAARFLTFWNPPAYLVHCSQAVLVDHDGPLLVRNYDLDPDLSEATLLRSAWTGRGVVASMEAIAGAADGVNEAGLAVSLAFGGRRATGPGFGVPLIVRYLLEVCGRTADAVEVLRRVPSHMSYNLTVVDRARRLRHRVPGPGPAVRDHPPALGDQPPGPGRVGRAGAVLANGRARRRLERLLAEPGSRPPPDPGVPAAAALPRRPRRAVSAPSTRRPTARPRRASRCTGRATNPGGSPAPTSGPAGGRPLRGRTPACRRPSPRSWRTACAAADRGLGPARARLGHGFSTVPWISPGMFLWTCRRASGNGLPVHALSANCAWAGPAPAPPVVRRAA